MSSCQSPVYRMAVRHISRRTSVSSLAVRLHQEQGGLRPGFRGRADDLQHRGRDHAVGQGQEREPLARGLTGAGPENAHPPIAADGESHRRGRGCMPGPEDLEPAGASRVRSRPTHQGVDFPVGIFQGQTRPPPDGGEHRQVLPGQALGHIVSGFDFICQ